MVKNSIYQQLENNGNKGNNFDTFMQNPMGNLARRGINVPQQYANNPHGAVEYLLNNGRMNRDAFNKVFNTLQRMGFRFN